MANKAKHAFGSLEKVDSAISSGAVDSFDVLFLKDEKGKPYVGWIDKNGEKVIVDDSAELAELESQLATKVSAEEVDEKISTKADISDVEASLATKADAEEVNATLAQKANTNDVEAGLATKAGIVEVDEKIDKAIADTVATTKAYTDGKIEAAVNEHLIKKYEITSIPEGTIVDYREKEIRVMCPVNTKWEKQSVGATGNANMYYMGFKAYAPENAVSFKEGDKGVIVDEMFTFDDDFAGTDEYGRKYSICWLALASYDESSDTWSYFGANSSADKYIGWTYVVEWYNANGIMIGKDSIRINLSNEDCHSEIKPYYITGISSEIDVIIEEKLNEITSAYEVIEF